MQSIIDYIELNRKQYPDHIAIKDKNRELYIHYAIGATVKHIDCGDKSSSQSVDEQIEKMAKFMVMLKLMK